MESLGYKRIVILVMCMYVCVCVCVYTAYYYIPEVAGKSFRFFDWFCDLARPRRRVRYFPSAGRQTENLIMDPNRTDPDWVGV